MASKTFKEKVKPFVNPTLIITIGGIIITGLSFVFDAIVEQNRIMIESQQLQFESPEQRIKTKDHINTPFNPVNAYKQSVELTKQTAIVEQVLEDNRKRDSIALIKEAEKDKSRDGRDAVNRLILEKLEAIENKE